MYASEADVLNMALFGVTAKVGGRRFSRSKKIVWTFFKKVLYRWSWRDFQRDHGRYYGWFSL
jgi:hypothetical protein